MTEKINLLNYNYSQLRSLLTELGESAFRAQQLMQWIHQVGLTDFDQMSNLSKSLRQKLKDQAVVGLQEIEACQKSADGTHKWLLKLSCGNCIETVYIPEKTRGTLCVSSQVGCSLNCSFFSTGKEGFNRNLSLAEIIGQVFMVVSLLKNTGYQLTNVVMMGMGEPLLNYQPVISAMDL